PVALHPDRPHIVFAGCYGGVIDRYDLSKDQVRNMNLYPQLQLGSAGADLKHRFQWVSPMLVSQHDPNTVYHGSQHVNRSRDLGETWETLSPDLTTDTPEHQVQSGGPINADVTGVEIFNVVFSIAESPFTAEEIWAGSDDGRIHVSRDDGATWTDVTPPGLPRFGTVDEIDLSRHAAGRAYVAVHAYRLDDFRPYIFRTDDWGGTWRLLTDGRNGIPADHPVRTVREDPEREGLLFAGTEYGIYVSFDGGGRWQSLQRDLPRTPVTGMKVAHDDLVLSTQGRSFWILDDITPLRELSAQVVSAPAHLFTPRAVHRVNKGGADGGLAELAPEGAPQGATIHYWLRSEPEGEIRLDVVDGRGSVVRTFSSDSAVVEETRGVRIPKEAGLHRITWDLLYPGPETPEGAVVWGYTGGVKAPPGTYRVRMAVGASTPQEASFQLLPDPRIPEVTQADYEEQFRVAIAVRDSITAVTQAIENLTTIRSQVGDVLERAETAGQADALRPLADTLETKATDVHEDLQQTKNQSGQDPIRFPPRLDNQWLELYNNVTGPDGYISGGPEGRPLPGAYERLEDLNQDWSAVRARYLDLLENELARFNEAVARLGLPAVVLPGRARIVS
ncbi:MAG: exo-alpha-sialidase, partial [Gemmatimonadetes bacterium]|nr:exo-alpha-sialidase [Gemmatimonadota bacterium]